HLLLALVDDREGIVPPVLEKIGVSVEAIAADARALVERLPKVSGGGATQAQLSAKASKVLESAFKEAERFKDETNSSLKRSASLKALSSTFEALAESCAWVAPPPDTLGKRSTSARASAAIASTLTPIFSSTGGTMPSRSSTSASNKC